MFKWAARISKKKLRKIYVEDAKGINDIKSIEDVGIILYLRCKDILAVKDAKNKVVRCPGCYSQNKEKFITRDNQEENLICDECGLEFRWSDFEKSYKENELDCTDDVKNFEDYIKNYEKADTAKEKMLVIDRLIHEFHHSYKLNGICPSRTVGTNLIEGELEDIIRFLDELSYEYIDPKYLVGAIIKTDVSSLFFNSGK